MCSRNLRLTKKPATARGSTFLPLEYSAFQLPDIQPNSVMYHQSSHFDSLVCFTCEQNRDADFQLFCRNSNRIPKTKINCQKLQWEDTLASHLPWTCHENNASYSIAICYIFLAIEDTTCHLQPVSVITQPSTAPDLHAYFCSSYCIIRKLILLHHILMAKEFWRVSYSSQCF